MADPNDLKNLAQTAADLRQQVTGVLQIDKNNNNKIEPDELAKLLVDNWAKARAVSNPADPLVELRSQVDNALNGSVGDTERLNRQLENATSKLQGVLLDNSARINQAAIQTQQRAERNEQLARDRDERAREQEALKKELGAFSPAAEKAISAQMPSPDATGGDPKIAEKVFKAVPADTGDIVRRLMAATAKQDAKTNAPAPDAASAAKTREIANLREILGQYKPEEIAVPSIGDLATALQRLPGGGPKRER